MVRNLTNFEILSFIFEIKIELFPSVMATAKGISASIASIIEAAAANGGT